MVCPECNAWNPLRSQRCRSCGHPFTWQAAARSRQNPFRQSRSQEIETAGPRDYRMHESMQPRTRRRRGVARRVYTAMSVFLLLAILVVATAAMLTADGNDQASRIGETVTERVREVTALIPSGDGDPEAPPEPVRSEFTPVGDQIWILSQDELNRRIAESGGQVGSASDVRIDLDYDQVTIRFRAFGIPGTYRANVVAVDGQAVVTNSSMSGPLRFFVSASDIDAMLNAELRQAARDEAVSVESVQVQPGRLVFGVSPL
jgi:hypothetical protein